MFECHAELQDFAQASRSIDVDSFLRSRLTKRDCRALTRKMAGSIPNRLPEAPNQCCAAPEVVTLVFVGGDASGAGTVQLGSVKVFAAGVPFFVE